MKLSSLSALGITCLMAAAVPAQADVHGLGALLPNTTKAAAAAPAGAAAALPTGVDLRAWSVPIGDQGQVGSCVAWTIAYDMMGWYANRNQTLGNIFAPMYMYSQINIGESQGQDSGAYAQDGFNLAVNQGVPLQSQYTYPNTQDWRDQPTAADRAAAAQHKATAYTVLFASNTGAGGGYNGQVAIQQVLATNNPVAISLRVRPGFDALSPYVLEDTDTTGSVRGNHEVMVVGYDANGLIIQNHWGTGWGSSGFGHLSWAVVQADVYEAEAMSVRNTVYRFSRNSPLQHFYTLSYSEGVNAGFRYEGIQWTDDINQSSGEHALYRCYIPGNGTHMVSTDPGCEGQVNEGSYGYVHDSQVSGSIPLYRFFGGSDHLITTNYQEGVNAGYRLESIEGYVTP